MIGQAATSYRVRLTSKDVKEIKKKGLFVNGFFVDVTQVNLLRRGAGNSGDVHENNERQENEEENQEIVNQWH
jgi:hypothetical protein